MNKCPCQSGNDYLNCCGRFIDKNELPETPEQLMRSRYTAYTLAKIDYIADTMKNATLQGFDKIQSQQWAQNVEWLGLKVRHANQVSADDHKGTVEFVARYRERGQLQFMHEISEFQKIDGRWFYTNGKTQKVGRNDECLCGSGKKLKKVSGLYSTYYPS
jgi:SEC-C motif-containing protein